MALSGTTYLPAAQDVSDPEDNVVQETYTETSRDLLLGIIPESSAAFHNQKVASSDRIRFRMLIAISAVLCAGLLVLALGTHLPGRVQVIDADTDEATQKQEIYMAPRTCPGTLPIEGMGQAAIVNTKPDQTTFSGAQQVEVQGGTLLAHMGGRAYLGDTCIEGTYDPSHYKAFQLLGNTLKYTVDLSGAGCGCDAAVYLASLKQNKQIGTCGDYYCDANSVCGVRCTELDIQEANMFAWRSTLHTSDDNEGEGFGYGGASPLQNSWKDGEYGPGARCIDTRRPFQVSVSFPVNSDGSLQSMQVTLTQAGSPCPLSGIVNHYHQVDGQDGMPEVTRALAEGMTPVVSFWKSDSMSWLDGQGPKGGVCTAEQPSQCPDYVRIYGLSFEEGATPAPGTPRVPPLSSEAAIAPVHEAAASSEWDTFPGQDVFTFQNVHIMSAFDLNACKQYARTHGLAAFVVWQGDAYFRQQSGPECRANLIASSDATTYISRAGLSDKPTALGAAAVPGWSEATDGNGAIYYYNTVTRQTSWTLPGH